MKDFVKASTASNGRSRLSALVSIVLLVPLLTACHATKHLSRSMEHDSVRVTITEQIRDTVVMIESDSSVVRALLECDSIGRIRMTELLEYRAGARIRPPKLTLQGNILTAEAHIDSLGIYLQWHERHQTTTSHHQEVVHDTVEVNRPNGWQLFWMRTGQITACGLVLLLGFKLRKLLFL